MAQKEATDNKKQEAGTPPLTQSSRVWGVAISIYRKLRMGLDTIAIVLSILGLALWLPSYEPNVQISSPIMIDATKWLSTPFAVTNNGVFAVYNVRYACRLNHIETESGKVFNNVELATTGFVSQILARSETFVVVCPFDKAFNINEKIRTGDINIIATYKPWPLRRARKCVRFTARQVGEQLLWLQQPETDVSRCK